MNKDFKKFSLLDESIKTVASNSTSPLPESVEKAAKKHYPNNPEFQLVFELGSNWQFNKQSAEVERLKKALEEIDELTEGYTAPHTLKVIAIAKEALKEK